MNKVILIGRLGQDPKIFQTHTGNTVPNLSIATDDSCNDQDGNRTEKTEWLELSLLDNRRSSALIISVEEGLFLLKAAFRPQEVAESGGSGQIRHRNKSPKNPGFGSEGPKNKP